MCVVFEILACDLVAFDHSQRRSSFDLISELLKRSWRATLHSLSHCSGKIVRNDLKDEAFLDAPTNFYKRVCPSVGRSVGPSVCPSIHPSVRRSPVFFKSRKSTNLTTPTILTPANLTNLTDSDKIWQIYLQLYLSPLLQTHLCLKELVGEMRA